MPTTTTYNLSACACCGGIDTGCCDDPIPSSLTATFSASSCAALHGITVSLTYQGEIAGTFYWQGTFSPGGTCGTLTFEFAIISGIACQTAQVIYDSVSAEVWGDSSGTGFLSCPFVSDTNTDAIPPCMSAIDCTGDLTVVVA